MQKTPEKKEKGVMPVKDLEEFKDKMEKLRVKTEKEQIKREKEQELQELAEERMLEEQKEL